MFPAVGYMSGPFSWPLQEVCDEMWKNHISCGLVTTNDTCVQSELKLTMCGKINFLGEI